MAAPVRPPTAKDVLIGVRSGRAGNCHRGQPEPGVLIWRTPAGHTYTTTPSVYQA
jgi:hypothetical protein